MNAYGDGNPRDSSNVATLYRDILVVALDDRHGAEPFRTDVLIENTSIVDVRPDIEPPLGARIVDGTDRLIMPGLINAHVHSWEAFYKGRYDNLPLELWMLYSYPILGLAPLSPELVYLRTMLVGIESLKNGVTCLLDDVIEQPGQSIEQLRAVFTAYRDLGIRANVSGNVVDKNFTATIPHLEAALPHGLRSEVHRFQPRGVTEYIDFSRQAFEELDGGLVRYVIAPSGPQRCTEEMLVAADALSAEFASPIHLHVLETRTQQRSGHEFYGKTLVQHLSDLGVLSRRMSFAHGIWVTGEDIDLIAASGVTVVHNPISNMKLGAGIAPWRSLLDAGVNVALGSDGLSSNDSARMFDVMKAAGLMHNVTSQNYKDWPTAAEVLHAATRGGARAVQLDDTVGAIEQGRAADLVVLDLRNISFIPLNDVRNHLVYCENGAAIEEVIVNGQVVVADGRCTLVDEETLLRDLRSVTPTLMAINDDLDRINHRLRPFLEQALGRTHQLDPA